MEAALYPIDTIKTRLQAMIGGGGMKALLQSGGGKGLYAGVWGNLVGVAPSSAIFMAFYEPVKQVVHKAVSEDQQYLGPVVAGERTHGRCPLTALLLHFIQDAGTAPASLGAQSVVQCMQDSAWQLHSSCIGRCSMALLLAGPLLRHVTAEDDSAAAPLAAATRLPGQAHPPALTTAITTAIAPFPCRCRGWRRCVHHACAYRGCEAAAADRRVQGRHQHHPQHHSSRGLPWAVRRLRRLHAARPAL